MKATIHPAPNPHEVAGNSRLLPAIPASPARAANLCVSRLSPAAHGGSAWQEGVDGSSPSEGSAKEPQTGHFSVGTTCRSSSVRWIGHLWSFEVQSLVLTSRRYQPHCPEPESTDNEAPVLAGCVGHPHPSEWHALSRRVALADNRAMSTNWRAFGAAAGVVFVILALIAFLIAPGPSEATDAKVFEYFNEHDAAILWQAALFGLSAPFFLWFAGTLAATIRRAEAPDATLLGGVALASAVGSASLYLVGIASWDALADAYGDTAGLESERPDLLGSSQVLFRLGLSAIEMANFTTAAFVGAAAIAFLSRRLLRGWLGWVGAVVAVVLLANGPLQVLSDSDAADVIGVLVFLLFLGWVLVTSVLLTRWTLRSGAEEGT